MYSLLQLFPIIQIIYYKVALVDCIAIQRLKITHLNTQPLYKDIQCSRPSESSRSAGQPCSQKVYESPFVYLYAIAQCRPSSQHWHKSLCHSAPPLVSEAIQVYLTSSSYHISILISHCNFTESSKSYSKIIFFYYFLNFLRTRTVQFIKY